MEREINVIAMPTAGCIVIEVPPNTRRQSTLTLTLSPEEAGALAGKLTGAALSVAFTKALGVKTA